MFFSREPKSKPEVPAPDVPEAQADPTQPVLPEDIVPAPTDGTSSYSRERFSTQVENARKASNKLPPINNRGTGS